MEENEGMMHWCALAEDEDVAVSVIDCLCDLGAEVWESVVVCVQCVIVCCSV